ncbi:hypothetical protein D3C76_1349790 [compost metagenome]
MAATDGGPFAPGIFEKGDITLAMRCDVTGAVERARRDDIAQASEPDPFAHGIGAAGLFERRFEHPVLEFGAVVQAVVGAEDGQHGAGALISGCANSLFRRH